MPGRNYGIHGAYPASCHPKNREASPGVVSCRMDVSEDKSEAIAQSLVLVKEQVENLKQLVEAALIENHQLRLRKDILESYLVHRNMDPQTSSDV